MLRTIIATITAATITSWAVLIAAGIQMVRADRRSRHQ